jgi:hypothetical protein
MDEIHAAHKEIGDTQEQQVVVIHKTAGIPGYGKDGEGNDDTEPFREAVEKKVIGAAKEIQTEEDRDSRKTKNYAFNPCTQGNIGNILSLYFIGVLHMAVYIPGHYIPRRDTVSFYHKVEQARREDGCEQLEMQSVPAGLNGPPGGPPEPH